MPAEQFRDDGWWEVISGWLGGIKDRFMQLSLPGKIGVGIGLLAGVGLVSLTGGGFGAVLAWPSWGQFFAVLATTVAGGAIGNAVGQTANPNVVSNDITPKNIQVETPQAGKQIAQQPAIQPSALAAPKALSAPAAEKDCNPYTRQCDRDEAIIEGLAPVPGLPAGSVVGPATERLKLQQQSSRTPQPAGAGRG